MTEISNRLAKKRYGHLYCLCPCLPDNGGSEGTFFAIALMPNRWSSFHAELIINARQTTSVTVTNNNTFVMLTVYGNSSEYFDVDYNMRVTDGTENKGWSHNVLV